MKEASETTIVCAHDEQQQRVWKKIAIHVYSSWAGEDDDDEVWGASLLLRGMVLINEQIGERVVCCVWFLACGVPPLPPSLPARATGTAANVEWVSRHNPSFVSYPCLSRPRSLSCTTFLSFQQKKKKIVKNHLCLSLSLASAPKTNRAQVVVGGGRVG